MTILDEICKYKREFIDQRQKQVPLAEMADLLGKSPEPRGFINAIKSKAAAGKPALIAEIKKASPSGGLIRPDFDPAGIAKAYENGGAACLSVLTDEKYFKGCNDDLITAHEICALPILRKEFILDPFQIYESRAMGADCILLIMAILTDSQAKDFYDLATELHMDVLVEIHDEKELERAMALSPAMIGINNRNLKTLQTNLETGLQLSKMLPDSVIKVAESGIYTNEELYMFFQQGFNAFLVGESLLRQNDLVYASQALLTHPQPQGLQQP